MALVSIQGVPFTSRLCLAVVLVMTVMLIAFYGLLKPGLLSPGHIKPGPPTPPPPKSHFSKYLGENRAASRIKINERGFWSGNGVAEYHSKQVASGQSKRVAKFFLEQKVRSVVDIGGGNGHFTRDLLDSGMFASCYDGNPNAQDVSAGVCATIDVTKPLRLARYDWVLTISVGRQIPPQYEAQFVSNLDALNKVGIVIYWGDGRPVVPTSVGKSVRDDGWVAGMFGSMGYGRDEEAEAYLRGPKYKSSNYSILVLRRNVEV